MLAPQERTIESCLALLGDGRLDAVRRAEALCCMGALLAHRRVAEALADADPELRRVLSTPVTLHTAGAQPPLVGPCRALLQCMLVIMNHERY